MKSWKTFLVSSALLTTSLTTLARGGSVVGNGAGLVESNFVFAYRMLPQIIDSCLKNPSCSDPSADRQALTAIQKVIAQSFSTAIDEKLQFVSNKETAGSFDLAADETHRIAKTCLDTTCPVFINTDLLYIEGKPAIDFGTAVGILFHEFGHQAGLENHMYLDSIAARLREIAESQHQVFQYPLPGFDVELHQYNGQSPMRYSELYATSSTKQTRLTPQVLEVVKKIPNWIGFELTNGHFAVRAKTSNSIKFSILVRVFVRDPISKVVTSQIHPMHMTFSATGEVLKIK